MFPIVENLINNKESMFIVDSKEEYINRYYDDLKNNNYNILILNLKDFDKSESWNPLEYPYRLYRSGNRDKALEYVTKIGKSLYYETSKESDPFWSISSSEFMTSIMFGLFDDGKENEINFNSINNMYNCSFQRYKYGVNSYLAEYISLKETNKLTYSPNSQIRKSYKRKYLMLCKRKNNTIYIF